MKESLTCPHLPSGCFPLPVPCLASALVSWNLLSLKKMPYSMSPSQALEDCPPAGHFSTHCKTEPEVKPALCSLCFPVDHVEHAYT